MARAEVKYKARSARGGVWIKSVGGKTVNEWFSPVKDGQIGTPQRFIAGAFLGFRPCYDRAEEAFIQNITSAFVARKA